MTPIERELEQALKAVQAQGRRIEAALAALRGTAAPKKQGAPRNKRAQQGTIVGKVAAAALAGGTAQEIASRSGVRGQSLYSALARLTAKGTLRKDGKRYAAWAPDAATREAAAFAT